MNEILFGVIIMIIVVWSVIWKGLALWNSSGKRDKPWFIIMYIFNTAGVLPLLYMIFKTDFFNKKKPKKRRKKK